MDDLAAILAAFSRRILQACRRIPAMARALAASLANAGLARHTASVDR